MNYVAHITLETIYELWENIEEQSWVGLRQVLNESYYTNSLDEMSGINASTIDRVVAMTRHLEYRGNPFPKSAEQLYHVINANLGFEEDMRRGL